MHNYSIRCITPVEAMMAIVHCKYDELLDPKTLNSYSKNANVHGQDQIERLAELYKYHGIRHPIIIDQDRKVIAAGHGRKLAAIRAGIDKFPVVYQKFETEDHLYAFCQADNAIATWSELDMSSINSYIPELGPDFNIDMMGIKNFVIDIADKQFDPSIEDEKKHKLCPKCGEQL